jgi:hypothetical protein
MKQRYKNIRMREDALALAQTIDGIIKEYTQQGLRLSLRQLYYACVSRNIVPNTDESYKRLGGIVSNGRLAGLLSWDAIEDRGRKAQKPQDFDSIESLLEVAFSAFRLPRMKGQPTYVELWVEKQALEGVLEPVAREFHVVLMANKGYSSQSALWEAACRIDTRCRNDDGDLISDAVILYLGDFDPSGEDMVRDVRERLQMFLDGYFEDERPEERTSPTGWNTDICGAVALTV